MAEETLDHGTIGNFSYGSHALGPSDTRCNLLRIDLDEAAKFGVKEYPFIALSYVWGACDPGRTILLNGKIKTVTPNLHDALFHIRGKLAQLKPVPLWVDAVCINQEDWDERAQQVAKMADIYSRASTVLFWLGPVEERSAPTFVVDDDYSGAMGVLSTIDRLRISLREAGFDSVNPWLLADKMYKNIPEGNVIIELNLALRVIYSLPLWTRVWIMQELVLAKHAFLLWGQNVIDFAVLEAQHSVRDDFAPSGLYFMRYEESLRLYGMAQQTIGLRSRTPNLLESLLAIRYRHATNPLDYVYGILGVSRIGTDTLTPDYTDTIRAVYTNAFRIVFRQEPNLDILSVCDRGWAETNQTTLTVPNWPSWLPDWSYEMSKTLSIDGDDGVISLVRSVLLDYQELCSVDFRAGGDTKIARISFDSERLHVHGIDFD